MWVTLDETLATTLVYIKGNEWIYPVHLSENAKEAAPEGRFAGKSHYLSVRVATKEELAAYRNVALNPHDQKNSWVPIRMPMPMLKQEMMRRFSLVTPLMVFLPIRLMAIIPMAHGGSINKQMPL